MPAEENNAEPQSQSIRTPKGVSFRWATRGVLCQPNGAETPALQKLGRKIDPLSVLKSWVFSFSRGVGAARRAASMACISGYGHRLWLCRLHQSGSGGWHRTSSVDVKNFKG